MLKDIAKCPDVNKCQGGDSAWFNVSAFSSAFYAFSLKPFAFEAPVGHLDC